MFSFLTLAASPHLPRTSTPRVKLRLWRYIFPTLIPDSINDMTTGAEKRPASDMFDTSQSLVKRQRSDANLTGGNDAVAVVNSSAQNGTLVQPVRGR